MTNDKQGGHDKGLLGMEALGRLPERERPGLHAHLDGCTSCRAELRQLQETAQLLGRIDAGRLVAPAPPPDLRRKVLASLAVQRTRSRRRAWLAVPAAASAAAAVVIVALVMGQPAGTEVTFTAAPNNVQANARLQDRSWGTGIRLDVAGLPAGPYQVWLERPDGTRLPAGSFSSPGPQDVGARLTVESAAAADRSDVVALGISRLGDDRSVVLRAPVR